MTPTDPVAEAWTLHVDGSSNLKGSRAGLLLESPSGIVIEVSLTFGFQTSNNQAEYEACIADLSLEEDFQASQVLLLTDSLLVASQINKQYEAKDPILQRYLTKVRELLSKFEKAEVNHVPRSKNQRADVLSKLASTKVPRNHRSVIQETLKQPSVPPMADWSSTICAVEESQSWIAPIHNCIKTESELTDPVEVKKVHCKATTFSVINEALYRRSLSSPLLKCIEGEEADYVLAEIHEGICGQQLGGKSLARKSLRAGYYWSTLQLDSKN